MAIELPDGTVLPSYLGVRSPSRPRDMGTHTNVALRVGEVKDIIYPDNPKSQSKNVIEYVVDVAHADGRGATVTTRYFAVPVGNLFGGVADFTRYTLRKDPGQDKNTTLGKGSKVMLLCVNGRTTSALILGGVHDKNQPEDDKEDGHNFEFEFNGVNALVNKDGELTVTYKGATNIEGDSADGVDTSKTGAKVTFDKDGNWKVEEVPTNIILKCEQGVLTGDATDHTVLGDTYRNAEHEMNTQVSAALKSMAGAATGIGTALTTTGAQLGAAGGGLVALAPGSAVALAGSAAALAVATTALGQLSAALTQAAAAIDTFEAQATQYLSRNNKSD